MDMEQKQAEVIDHFVNRAAALKGAPLISLIVQAITNPSLFAFSEILSVPNVLETLPYSQLMQELDITNVRELEDFLINECIYVGIVQGKLDQLGRCFGVQFAAGRDLRPGQLRNMIHTLSDWLSTSDNMLHSIQEKIKWADDRTESDKKSRKEVEDRIEQVKKSLSVKGDGDSEFRGHESGGVMDHGEDRNRPKRRRHPRLTTKKKP